jgi:hypothetical protein
VTHSPRVEEGERVVTTDVWRVFSEVKGDSNFHNTALSQIVGHYKEKIPDLRQAHVFTDGCRAQYKGRRNFLKIAGFPSLPEHKGVILRHHFACGHHFKGPHDAYGKDPKFLGRMAERQQRWRIATTHDFYTFCVVTLPAPKKLTAKQIVTALPAKDPTELQRLPPAELPHLFRQPAAATETEAVASGRAGEGTSARAGPPGDYKQYSSFT